MPPKYYLPTNHLGKLSTRKEELQSLIDKTDDPVLKGILEIRSLGTIINNYIPNWRPHADGRVHTRFNFAPPNQQLATRKPNTQNTSPHSELGLEFREIIVAPKGHIFVEFDYQRFHVHTMAWCANDPDYHKFAKLDCHSIFASHLIHKPIDMGMPDDQIRGLCEGIKSEFKKERDKKAKPTILGNQLGLGFRKLYWMNKDHLSGEAEAKNLQGILSRMFPRVEQFKWEVREKADKEHVLINPWGARQHFYDIFNWRYSKKVSKWVRGHGSDSERAVAFLVQSCAFGMIFDKLLELEEKEANERYNFLNTNHDSLFYMPREEDLDRCIETTFSVMQSPCTKLTRPFCPDGLQVGVDVKVGRSWATLREVKI